MNDYEARRQEKIKANQKLLAELDIKALAPSRTRKADSKPPPAKKRRVQEQAPSRTSARIASAPSKPTYNDAGAEKPAKPAPLPRSSARKHRSKKTSKPAKSIASTPSPSPEPLVPAPTTDTIVAGWTAWTPTAPPPTRDPHTQTFQFADHPTFAPNKSPEEMLRQGVFGGSYYRPLKSRKLGVVVEDDWQELPGDWIDGLSVLRFLANAKYDADVNRFKVACGQSIEEWEASGWIAHEFDVRGWFQWYTRFFLGRRCADDERQVGRWARCVGERGRWRRALLKKYLKAGVREVWDDGAEEEGEDVSPVMHQTCFHWAFEVRQEHLDEFWASGGA